MEHFDAGHEETQVELPDPLAGGLWHLGTWALPATTLSVASVVVFAMILGWFLASPERRVLFALPFHPAGLALGSAFVAWAIVVSCRRRPGRIGSRLWPLILAGLTTATAGVSLSQYEVLATPLLHALVVAGAAAVLTLLPRLARVQPHRKLLQRIVPLTLLGVSVTILPSACYLGRSMIDQHQQQLDGQIIQLQRWAAAVRDVTGYDWQLMPGNPESAAEHVNRLGKLSFSGVLADSSRWRAAEALAKQEALSRAAQDLIDAVAEGLEPGLAPRLSQLSDPAVRWDPTARRWVPNTRFLALSQTTAEYHRHLTRLFLELQVEDAPTDSSALVSLERYSSQKRQEIRAHLATLARSWPDGWVAYQTPEHETFVGAQRPLVELLRGSLVDDADDDLAAVDLGGLMRLHRDAARELGRKAAGCRTPEYAEGDREYFRLDCFAYAPRDDALGAELRVEVRVAYESTTGASLASTSTPVKIHYLFPVPEGLEAEAYSEAVMGDIHTGVRELWNGSLKTVDPGGSASSGLRLIDGTKEIRIHRPHEIDFLDDRSAIEVRAEKV